MDTKRAITIEFDIAQLSRYSDERLAMLWHVAQANPADCFTSREPGDIAEKIGREIIRRWLASVRPELWHQQGEHYFWKQLSSLATYEPGGPTGTPQWEQGRWIPKTEGE